MATDIKLLINNLVDFYDFGNKEIISVGAGGGQLIEYGRRAGHVTAIDNDDTALKALKQNLIKAGLDNKYTLIHSDFCKADLKADALIFEFCLHEIEDAGAAIRHAQTMAPDVIIADHLPGSEWCYIGAEDEKTAKSWKAINTFSIKSIKNFEALQTFTDYNELYQRVRGQGPESIKRISRYQNTRNISIPMAYAFVLL